MSPQNVGVFFNISKYRLLVISYYKLFGTGKALKSLLGLNEANLRLIHGYIWAKNFHDFGDLLNMQELLLTYLM